MILGNEQRSIVAYLDGLDLSPRRLRRAPRPSQMGRELVAQWIGFSPLGETGEGLYLSALLPSVLDRAFKGEL